jgi:hypothetical protein
MIGKTTPARIKRLKVTMAKYVHLVTFRLWPWKAAVH